MNKVFNLDKLRTISNPMLVGAMALVAKENTYSNNKVFIDELKRATLLVQLYITPPPTVDEKGNPKLTPENRMEIPTMNMNGKKYFLVYTDLGEIRNKKEQPEGMMCIVPYNLKQLSTIITQTESCDGFVINPSSNGMVLTTGTLATIFSRISEYEGEKKETKE